MSKNNITLYNKSKQMLGIMLKSPDGDFYKDQQQINLKPGETVTVPSSYTLRHQIKNLCAKNMLSIVK